MPKKDEYVKFKNYYRKIKSLNPEDSHTKNVKKHIACSYVYKLVYAKDKFSKPFKIYLDEDAVCNSINMIKEGKYCNQLIKKVLMKNL